MWHTDAWIYGIERHTALLPDRTANSPTYYATLTSLIDDVSLTIVSLIVISDTDYNSHKSYNQN